jgi:hypothetical protein
MKERNAFGDIQPADQLAHCDDSVSGRLIRWKATNA